MSLFSRFRPANGSTAALGPERDWQSTEPWVSFGMKTVVYMVGGMLAFSILVSISGAVVATGTVTVETNYKTVQHLDGGIVSKILVRNGDTVKSGDILVRLDATQIAASHAVATTRVHDLLVQQARLEAERDRRDTIALPAEIDEENPEIARVIGAQRSMFEARRTSRMGEQSVLRQRLEQLKGEIAGNGAQMGARKKELAINVKELASVMPLYEKGYVNQQRVAPLQRESARLEGEIGRLEAESGKLRGAVAEIDLRIQQSEKAFTETVVDELKKVQAQLSEQQEARKALADKLDRIDIRAPRGGRIHAIAVHTEGGVITPASPILQIIPDDERLVVEAHVPPQDIDKVRAGHHAGIRFPAFNARLTPRLEGSVAKVSAAQHADPQGRSYFTAEIEIPATELKRLPSGHTLIPGMPAEVFIETQSRSILSYFLKPLTDAMSRAFREG